MLHSFPGNIRELENIIEYGFILCTGGFIQEEHLPESFLPESQKQRFGSVDMESGLTLEQIEQQAIHNCLERNKWKKMITCKELGISKDTLRRKIERYSLDNPLDPD